MPGIWKITVNKVKKEFSSADRYVIERGPARIELPNLFRIYSDLGEYWGYVDSKALERKRLTKTELVHFMNKCSHGLRMVGPHEQGIVRGESGQFKFAWHGHDKRIFSSTVLRATLPNDQSGTLIVFNDVFKHGDAAEDVFHSDEQIEYIEAFYEEIADRAAAAAAAEYKADDMDTAPPTASPLKDVIKYALAYDRDLLTYILDDEVFVQQLVGRGKDSVDILHLLTGMWDPRREGGRYIDQVDNGGVNIEKWDLIFKHALSKLNPDQYRPEGFFNLLVTIVLSDNVEILKALKSNKAWGQAFSSNMQGNFLEQFVIRLLKDGVPFEYFPKWGLGNVLKSEFSNNGQGEILELIKNSGNIQEAIAFFYGIFGANAKNAILRGLLKPGKFHPGRQEMILKLFDDISQKNSLARLKEYREVGGDDIRVYGLFASKHQDNLSVLLNYLLAPENFNQNNKVIVFSLFKDMPQERFLNMFSAYQALNGDDIRIYHLFVNKCRENLLVSNNYSSLFAVGDNRSLLAVLDTLLNSNFGEKIQLWKTIQEGKNPLGIIYEAREYVLLKTVIDLNPKWLLDIHEYGTNYFMHFAKYAAREGNEALQSILASNILLLQDNSVEQFVIGLLKEGISLENLAKLGLDKVLIDEFTEQGQRVLVDAIKQSKNDQEIIMLFYNALGLPIKHALLFEILELKVLYEGHKDLIFRLFKEMPQGEFLALFKIYNEQEGIDPRIYNLFVDRYIEGPQMLEQHGYALLIDILQREELRTECKEPIFVLFNNIPQDKFLPAFGEYHALGGTDPRIYYLFLDKYQDDPETLNRHSLLFVTFIFNKYDDLLLKFLSLDIELTPILQGIKDGTLRLPAIQNEDRSENMTLLLMLQKGDLSLTAEEVIALVRANDQDIDRIIELPVVATSSSKQYMYNLRDQLHGITVYITKASLTINSVVRSIKLVENPNLYDALELGTNLMLLVCISNPAAMAGYATYGILMSKFLIDARSYDMQVAAQNLISNLGVIYLSPAARRIADQLIGHRLPHNPTLALLPTIILSLNNVLNSFGELIETALPYFTTETKKTKSGDRAKAQYDLGIALYQKGDTDNGKEALEKAARNGHGEAQFILGSLLEQEGHSDKAEYWFSQAAMQGHPEAEYNLGVRFNKKGQTNKAMEWFKQSAEHGYTEAQYNFAVLLRDTGKKEDAKKWFKTAADKQHVNAQYNLGVMLREEGKKDEAKAMFRKSADKEDADSQYDLGLMLYEEGEIDQAGELFLKAAKQGREYADRNLALVLKEGAKINGANEWLLEQTMSGQDPYSLGVKFYKQGKKEAAKENFIKAARQGDSGAQYMLGLMLRDEGKKEESRALFMEAVKDGYAGAQYELGVLLHDEGKTEEAKEWFKKAAAQDHPKAKRNLKVMLREEAKMNAMNELPTNEDQVDETEARFLVSTVDEQRELDILYPKAEAALKPFKKFCIVNGNKATMVHDSLSTIMDLCKKYGGKLLSHTEMLALRCNSKPDDHILVAEEVGVVTCGNYQKVYIDTPDGDYQINNDAFPPVIGHADL